jgi:hypothetical protein
VGFAFLLVGFVLTISGVQGTQDQLFAQVQKDFTGQGSFIYWLASIGIIGGAGYVEELQGLSRAFLALILLVLILSNGKVFDQFTQALKGSTAPPQTGTTK